MVNYYTVIPAVKLPRAAPDEYTYLYPNGSPLKPNTLVSIPFRKSTTKGLITGTTRKPPFSVKPIKNVIRSLPPRFSEFLIALSRLTFEHPGTLLRLSLLHKVEGPQLSLIGSNRSKINSKTSIKQYQTTEERISWIITRARQATKLNRALLIIIPNVFEASLISDRINDHNIPCILFTGSNTTQSSVRTPPSYHCVVSTRIGCLLPFAFNETICDDEPNELYIHNEPSPAYDARTVMELRTSFLNESLTYSGYSISLAAHSLHDIRRPNNSKFRIPDRNSLQWVSIPNNLRYPKTPFTEPTIEKLTEAPKDVIVITRAGGYARSVACASCGYELQCPLCERPFRSISDHQLQCPRCSALSTMPPFCPVCSGPTFRYQGFGANRVTEIISKVLPDPASSVTSTTFQQFEQRLAERPLERSYSVVIPCADALISPEFDGQEMVYHRLVKLCAQTHPNPIVAQYFSERLRNDFEQITVFFERELALRKSLKLPPNKTLLRIRYYHPRASKKNQLSFEHAQRTIASILGVEYGDMQCISQKRRGLPYFLFYARIDPKSVDTIEWRKIPVGFHCQQCR